MATCRDLLLPAACGMKTGAEVWRVYECLVAALQCSGEQEAEAG